MTGTGDIIDNYLLWELCKKEGIGEKIVEASDGEKLEEVVGKVKRKYREKDYSLEEKMDRVREVSSNPGHKVKMFEYCSWEKETVKVDDLGTTLPHAMSLPPEVISGSLLDVVEFVREADPEECRSIEYIMGLKQAPEVLNEFLPTVITPGNIIRRQDRMSKAYGEKNWEIEAVWGAIHDGNHRTVAKILANDLKEIECYVGRPSSDKIYEHVKL
ncbi:MAG: hypothetical protein ABEJ93_04905 [Candidatus Nanohalobium sp.]